MLQGWMVTFALNTPIVLLRNDAQDTVTAVHQTPVMRESRCSSMRKENVKYKYVVWVEICVIDSFTPDTSQLRAIIAECGGDTGLEQPGPTFDSLAAYPSDMPKNTSRQPQGASSPLCLLKPNVIR
jgi:hypothetical protein